MVERAQRGHPMKLTPFGKRVVAAAKKLRTEERDTALKLFSEEVAAAARKSDDRHRKGPLESGTERGRDGAEQEGVPADHR
ncbi:hypothetical protein [Streptomyces sp. NPDC017448]|uniref:hypothetical protein n=1 Tax=Streptomyces sp. NPDC017448 TaxID=3364996 RepID=UPI0037A9F492